MDRNEFISTLRAVLTGEVSVSVVEDNVNYYNNYISAEIAKGKSEVEVMDLLGDPRLIAKTIIETSQGAPYGEGRTSSYSYSESDTREEQKGFHSQSGMDIRFGNLNLNSWYGKLLMIVIVTCALLVVFTIVGGVFTLLLSLLPYLIPFLVILWVIRMFSGR